MDLFSHGNGMRFLLRRGVLLEPLAAPRTLFLALR
jgi:hypothetical protein